MSRHERFDLKAFDSREVLHIASQHWQLMNERGRCDERIAHLQPMAQRE